MSRSDCSPITIRSINSRHLAAFLITSAGLVAGVAGSAQAAPTKASGQTSGVNNSGTSADTQNVGINKPMRVKMGKTSAEFIIATPQAKVSTATRVINPAAPQHNITREVYAELLVSTTNEQTLARVLQSATRELGTDVPGSHAYRPYLDLGNTFIVEALNVEDAINLANRLENMDGVNWAEINYREPLKNMGAPTITTDPNAPFQWHVFNDPGLFAAPFDGNHFIDQAYARGYSGAGVTVGVLEAFQNSFYRVDENDVLFIHPDLALKTNFNLSRETDPHNDSYSHGVSVAGLIGAEGNNGIHGAGVAYGSTLVSLRNGNQIDQGLSLGWQLNAIDIINNSWGPDNESFPTDSTGRYLRNFPDDFEIDVPQITSSNFSRPVEISLDRGIRLGRGRDGRVFVFSAGNSNHFQSFERLAVGNAISLPGIGPDPMAAPFGYLDTTSLDPMDNMDTDFDGIPDSFNLDGSAGLGLRWSGHLGGRTEYNPYASLSRTIAIGAVGQSRSAAGYSTTGTAVFVAGYSQDSLLNTLFTPDPGGGYFASAFGLGLVTIEQEDTVDSDLDGFGVDCNAVIPGLAFTNDDIESCMFNGTSAAAPVASGIIALMLEANPSLTLRDIQTILQQTAIVPEATGADPAGSDFFDTTKTYWANVFFGLGPVDPDDPNTNGTPTFWSSNSAGIRHSDEYGFGIIDAAAAVQAAETWRGVSQLVLLDSGVRASGDDDGNPLFTDGTIADATFTPAVPVSENLETNVLTPGELFTLQLACVRDNIQIEGVELELTISGEGVGDLMIALIGPRGTVSPLAIPRGDSSNSYTERTFTTYKHWGELAGGTWTLAIQDFRPDEDSPEGEPPDDMPDPMDPSSFGVEQVTYLGAFGLPGNPDHDGKELVSYRLRIYGTDIGADVFDACPPLLTGCPADLNGDGIVDLVDLQIFISWYLAFDTRADFNGDGNIDYLDVVAYRVLWVPGFCGGNTGYIGGRPRPGTTDLGDNDPQTRPI